MTKKRVTKPKASPTPKAVVQAWHNRIVTRLKPWSLDDQCFKRFEPKLRRNIRDLVKGGQPFTAADMRNSLRVAGDVARICKILQPAPNPKVIRFDTFESVLKLCATKHLVCKIQVQGGGGWCNVNA
jgi:hypothetical protein